MDDCSSVRRSQRAAHQASAPPPSPPETFWDHAPGVAASREPFSSFFTRDGSNPFFLSSASSNTHVSAPSSVSAQNAPYISSSSAHPSFFPFSGSSSVRSAVGVNPFSHRSQDAAPPSGSRARHAEASASSTSMPRGRAVLTPPAPPPPPGFSTIDFF